MPIPYIGQQYISSEEDEDMEESISQKEETCDKEEEQDDLDFRIGLALKHKTFQPIKSEEVEEVGEVEDVKPEVSQHETSISETTPGKLGFFEEEKQNEIESQEFIEEKIPIQDKETKQQEPQLYLKAENEFNVILQRTSTGLYRHVDHFTGDHETQYQLVEETVKSELVSLPMSS